MSYTLIEVQIILVDTFVKTQKGMASGKEHLLSKNVDLILNPQQSRESWLSAFAPVTLRLGKWRRKDCWSLLVSQPS